MILRIFFVLVYMLPFVSSAQAVYDAEQIKLAFSESEEIDVLVRIKGQYVLPANALNWSKDQRAKMLYQGLRQVAEQSQARLRAAFAEKAIPYQSFFLVNALRLKVDKADFEWLSDQHEVAWISVNIPLVMPRHTKEVSVGSAREPEPT